MSDSHDVFARVSRRTMTGLFFSAVWLLLADAFGPPSAFSSPRTLPQVILAAVLAVGLVPGVYLHRLISRMSAVARGSTRRRLVVGTIVAPCVVLALAGVVLSGTLNDLGLLQGLPRDIGAITRWRLVEAGGVILIMLTVLVANLLALYRSDR
ncbi:MAG: hypothetical protein AB1449_13665 [Chloroflexota bacterium]